MFSGNFFSSEPFFFSPIIKVIIENSENIEKNKENINPTQS